MFTGGYTEGGNMFVSGVSKGESVSVGEFRIGTTDRGYGNGNTGNCNPGYCNSGDHNSGDRNTGDKNIGNRNPGDSNTGNWNSGDRNSGNWNTGDENTGSRNSGDSNAGNWNSGRHNSGDRNSGDWNCSSGNNGCFMTAVPTIMMFNRPCSWTLKDWRNSDAFFIMEKCPTEFPDVSWIPSYRMTDEEKEKQSEHPSAGGYLQTADHDTDRQAWWDSLPEEEKTVVMSLPNFDADVFFNCTGIRVRRNLCGKQ